MQEFETIEVREKGAGKGAQTVRVNAHEFDPEKFERVDGKKAEPKPETPKPVAELTVAEAEAEIEAAKAKGVEVEIKGTGAKNSIVLDDLKKAVGEIRERLAAQ